ncbi:MAG TPA: site-2 protease family protein [Dermatophilaceae bacterium]|nr:site-2 protease family protein [Dermatophilaceae bacterium]
MTQPLGSSTHGWRIATLGGVPVYLGRSWPIIAVVVVALYGPDLDDGTRPTLMAYLIACGYAVIFLLSVLLHEAAHALVARWRGQRVDRVVADVWGGHTVYEAREAAPGTMALVAVVGPLANLALGAMGWLVLPFVGDDTTRLLVYGVAFANTFVGVFNLLPALPMDGGQIASALIWRLTGRRSTGTTVAGWLGRLLAAGLVIWAVARSLSGGQPDLFTLMWTGLIAMFLWQGASQAIRSGPILDATAGPFAEVLEPTMVVQADESVEDVVARASSMVVPMVVVVVDEAGTPLGTVDPGAALAVPPADRGRTLVSAIYVAQPESWVIRLPPEATLADLVRPMVTSSLTAAAVLDGPSGEVLGVARAERVNDFIEAAIARLKGR